MKPLFYKFWRNIIDSFGGYNWIYHLIAIAATYIIVVSDFDWKYFQFFQGSRIYYILFSAVIIGSFFPVILPVILLIFGKVRKNFSLLNTGFALGQAAILGEIISSLYKVFTGRAHPDIIQSLTTNVTHIFNFGILRGGIFWGWPSSHTTVAFAMAFTLWAMYSKNKLLKTLALVYALFIGLGVSMSIHWFSDFVAGAIIGTVIGIVVGKAFRGREQIPIIQA